MITRVLVVDDHLEMARMLADSLGDAGFQAEALDSGKTALEQLESQRVDALVTDLRMGQVSGLDLLAASKRLAPHRPVIIMTAYGAIESAVESIRLGAYHYLTKPFQPEELCLFLRRALEERDLQWEARQLRRALRGQPGGSGPVGSCAAMRQVWELAERMAAVDVPVLLRGETGTGKSMVAEFIHHQSPRAKAPFVAVNCAALPEALLESELFGHAKGAFTGATVDRPGLFVEAEGGTVLLDEVGELPASIQAKLLHVLERGAIRPVGQGRERKVDVRILAATHRDLLGMVQLQSFREDLLYRLDVVSIEIPALRHRRDDILPLVEHFLQLYRAKYPESPLRSFSVEALGCLMDYGWPGNVRELAHFVQRAVVLGKGTQAGPEDLPASLRKSSQDMANVYTDIVPVRELHHRYAAWSLERCGGHKGRTAERLGIDVKTLNRWLSEDTATEG